MSRVGIQELSKKFQECFNEVLFCNWREHAVFQRSAFGGSTAGNDVVATIFIRLFLFFPRFFFPPSQPFLIERVLGSKNLFSKSCLERPKKPFWGPLAAILDFAGIAGGERAPPSPLGWYFVNAWNSLQLREQKEKQALLLLG